MTESALRRPPRPIACASVGYATASCPTSSTRRSSTRRSCASSTPPAAPSLPRPGRPQGRSAERQARSVGRVRRLPRLLPRRRPAPARLERPRPAREAVRQALRRGGGRDHHASCSTPSASMAAGRPAKLDVREAGRSGTRLHRPGIRGPDPSPASTGRTARRQRGLRGSGRVFRLSAACPASRPPTARRISSPRPGTPRPQLTRTGRGHPAAPTSSTQARTGSSASSPRPDRRSSSSTSSSPEELDPALEGDLRLVDAETGDGVDVTVDLAMIDDYKRRLATWQEGLADLAAKRRVSYVPIASDLPIADLMFAELRRRRVLG